MIVSFGSKKTESIWEGEFVKSVPREIQELTRRKLRMIDAASTIRDLQIPPSNHLKKLSGNLKEYYSIRVNDRWRIIFKWAEDLAIKVELVDYH